MSVDNMAVTLSLSGDVDYNMFNELTKSLNQVGPIIIYFSTEGGLIDVAEAIIDIINRNKHRVKMIFYGEVFSAGMHIFLKTMCEKELLNEVRGMYHFSYQEMSISEGGKPSEEYDKFSLKEMTRSKKDTLEYLKTLPITEKEISAIRRGKEVYFSYHRMQEILEKIK